MSLFQDLHLNFNHFGLSPHRLWLYNSISMKGDHPTWFFCTRSGSSLKLGMEDYRRCVLRTQFNDVEPRLFVDEIKLVALGLGSNRLDVLACSCLQEGSDICPCEFLGSDEYL